MLITRSILLSGTVCWALFTAVGNAPAQSARPVRLLPLPGAVRDGGVLHLASGTWSRGRSGQSDLGSRTILYRNDAFTGVFGSSGVAADLYWIDEGRVPSTSGHPNATADSYLVQGIQFAYCSSEGPAGQVAALEFYDSYRSCTDPSSLIPVGTIGPLTLPGSAAIGVGACWIVAFDLQGTSLEFMLSGDADGMFDGTTALDNFGWQIYLQDVHSGGSNGPILAGDPEGHVDCVANPYGDGTYYQNPSAAAGTGLGTLDQFWLDDPSSQIASGCYWFGGDPPFSSFWLRLLGEAAAAAPAAPKQVVYLNFGCLNKNSEKSDSKLYSKGGVHTETMDKGNRKGFAPTFLRYPNDDDRAAVIDAIVDQVKTTYGDFDISFTVEKPTDGEFSTISILSGTVPELSDVYNSDGVKYGTAKKSAKRIDVKLEGLDGYYIDLTDGKLHRPDGSYTGRQLPLDQVPHPIHETCGLAIPTSMEPRTRAASRETRMKTPRRSSGECDSCSMGR